MTQLNPDRFPILTEAIEAVPEAFHGASPESVQMPAHDGLPPDLPQEAPRAVSSDGDALARQMRGQVRLAVERLQEQLRAEVAHRMDVELEARVAALLAARLERLAGELADALRPALLDVVRQAVADVLDPDAGNS